MNSSCLVWAWRSDDIEFGARRVRLTPKLARPNKSRSGRFSLPAMRDAKGSGYTGIAWLERVPRWRTLQRASFLPEWLLPNQVDRGLPWNDTGVVSIGESRRRHARLAFGSLPRWSNSCPNAEPHPASDRQWNRVVCRCRSLAGRSQPSSTAFSAAFRTSPRGRGITVLGPAGQTRLPFARGDSPSPLHSPARDKNASRA